MKKFKILILILGALLILGVSFGVGNTSTGGSDIIQDSLKMLQKILNLLFILVRPFLIIAGKFLSNSFVYGSAFSIDAVLWSIWQMVRTGMNYFVGMVFIVSIFVYLFKSNSKLSISQIFPKLVFSTIIINMSWFLFAVLLDISSILLVAAGSIGEQFNTLIGNATERDPQKDVVLLPVTINTDAKEAVLQTKVNGKQYDFCILDKDLQITNPSCIDFRGGVYKLIVDKSGKTEEIKGGITAADLNYSSVGMLFSIFRYMNMAFVTDNTDKKNATFWMYLLKVILMLALVIPFILLAVILFIRLMVLWIVIPLSPILFGLPILGVFDSKVKDKLTNIVALIFQPAYVVFMLSLGFILIQALYAMMPTMGGQKKSENILKQLYIEEKGKNEVELAGVLNIKSTYDKGSGTTTKMGDYKNLLSYIAWIIANLISIMVLWVLVFTAFKSNSFTKKIAMSVDTMVRQGVKTIPFLPGGQSISSLGKAGNYLNAVPEQLAQSQFSEGKQKLDKFFK